MELGKIAKIAFRILVGIGIVYAIIYLLWFKGDEIEGSDKSMIVSYILGIGALAATVVAAVAGIMHSPKSAIKFLVGVVGLGLVAFIAYSMSDGSLGAKYEDWGMTEAYQSKLVDSGLYAFYVALGLSLAGIVVSEVMSYIKG